MITHTMAPHHFPPPAPCKPSILEAFAKMIASFMMVHPRACTRFFRLVPHANHPCLWLIRITSSFMMIRQCTYTRSLLDTARPVLHQTTQDPIVAGLSSKKITRYICIRLRSHPPVNSSKNILRSCFVHKLWLEAR